MFGYYTLSTKLPAYLESVLRIPIESNGNINAFTYISASITMAVVGPLTERIKSRFDVSNNVIRKVCESIGKFSSI